MVKYLNFIKNIKNPYIIFLPFLFFYFLLVLKYPTHGTYGDEERYTSFAQNLINGFYSPPSPEINLWNGPGYPIVLIPFILFHLPLVSITLFNAILYYFSLILLFKTLQQFFSFKITLFVSFVWACYVNSYGEMKIIYCEVLTSFLICLLLFCLVKSFNIEKKSRKFAIYSGLIMGFIVLTKVIFGYVVLLMLFGMAILCLLNRKSLSCQRGFFIVLIALTTISPYLIYTYQLTGKIYYLGNSGGMSLYWMSATDENEFGDWFHERNIHPSKALDLSIDSEAKTIPGWNNYLYANHAKDYAELDKYTGVKRDDIYKKIAIGNIKQHPLKYVKNCISNIERLFFSFPYSYTLQHNIFQLAINGPIVLSMFFSFIITIINWRKIIFPLRFILFFIFIYLSLTITVSAYTRMFTVIVPIILFWIAFIFQKSLKLKLRFENSK